MTNAISRVAWTIVAGSLMLGAIGCSRISSSSCRGAVRSRVDLGRAVDDDPDRPDTRNYPNLIARASN